MARLIDLAIIFLILKIEVNFISCDEVCPKAIQFFDDISPLEEKWEINSWYVWKKCQHHGILIIWQKNAHKTTIFKGYKKNLSTGSNMSKKNFPFEWLVTN